MEQGTINGIPIQVVFQKLKEDIPGIVKYTQERDAKPYLDATIQRRYFEELIPPVNYDFQLTDVKLVQMSSRACFVCTGTLTVYDDVGRKVVIKSYTGSNNCIVGKESGEPVDLAMDARNAAVSARKGCISLFGCGERQLEQAKEKNKGRGTYSSEPASRQGTPSTSVNHQGQQQMNENRPPTGRGKYLLVRNERKEAKTYPTMILIPVKCREYQDYETVLLIWKNRHKDVDAIYNRIEAGAEFCCEGKFEKYNSDYRIVLERMDGRHL